MKTFAFFLMAVALLAFAPVVATATQLGHEVEAVDSFPIPTAYAGSVGVDVGAMLELEPVPEPVVVALLPLDRLISAVADFLGLDIKGSRRRSCVDSKGRARACGDAPGRSGDAPGHHKGDPTS